MKRIFIGIVIVLSLVIVMAGCAPAGKPKIGLSFSDFATERWSVENALMTQLLKDKGYDVIFQEANHDVKLQNDQIDNMVAQGVKALLIVPEDGDACATAVANAAKKGIPVIAYDRLIKSSDIAAYLSFDNVAVGRGQAAGILSVVNKGKFVLLGGSPTDNNAHLVRAGQMEVLKPLIDSGDITIVADQWVENWDPAKALGQMENILTGQQNKIDAVVASNDGTALGALEALKAQKLAGIVPISGQDATATGCNSIVKGELTVSVFKDTRKLVPMAIELVDKLVKKVAIEGLKEFDLATLTGDTTKTGNVKCYFLDVVQITKANVYQEIVKSGFQKKEDVYRDIPADQIPND